MMRQLGIQMTTVVAVADLLSTLETNRANHGRIVSEAREGYLKKAQEAISKRLDDLRSGKLVSLEFSLRPPQDFTEAYDTAIKMLQWTTQKEVTLSADEFRHLVMDEWSWLSDFLMANSAYSAGAVQYAATKGIRV